MGIVPLAGKDGRHPLAPGAFDGVQDAQLVVDQDVPPRGEARLHVIQLVLFVDVDQHVPFHGRPQPRTLDLARLKDDVAVGQDHHRADRLEQVDHVERLGVEPIGEGIVDQVGRQVEDTRIARMLDAIALQRTEIVRIAELAA